MINIDELIKEAMKSKNEVELQVYRLIKSEILKYKTAKNAKSYTAESEIEILKKMAKSHEESILMYSEAGRMDLVSKEEDELKVIEKLLPAAPSLSEIENFVKEYLKESNFQISKKEMGSTIKYIKSVFPMADGKTVSNIISKYIV